MNHSTTYREMDRAADETPAGLVACHECDALHRLERLKPGQTAHCHRCSAELYRDARHDVDEALAYTTAAAIAFVIANFFPFLGLKLAGRIEENIVASGVVALTKSGQIELGVLVALTSIIFPAVTLLGLLWILLPLKLGKFPPFAATVFRIITALGPWTLMGVFMLGVLIAFVKLGDLATIVPGVSLFAFAALMLFAAAATSKFDSSMVWPPQGPSMDVPDGVTTARQAGLSHCHTCRLLVLPDDHGAAQNDAFPREHGHCPRCASALHASRAVNSVGRTWALVIAAAVLCIPANVYPVMTVIQFGQGDPSTSMGGVILLIQQDMFGLAFVVFFASIAVPVLKLALLIFLLVSVQRRSPWRPKDRTLLYRVTEVVGAWSMVDIFLVGILSAIVQLGALATIEPGIGASFFGAVVVVTMFAAKSFDPRLIWDHAAERE